MHKRGFTLIEMMVAVGLFVVVALISTSALIAMSSALRRAQNIKTLVEATGIAMDSMALRMTTKTQSNFTCPQFSAQCNAVTGTNSIQFRYGSPAITYKYELQGSSLMLTKGVVSPSALTPPGVKVNSVKFYVQNSGSGLDRATIVINASLVSDPSASIIMQTTIAAI